MRKTDLYERRFSDFRKNHPNRLAAVLANFTRYWEMLKDQPQARLVTANFVHDERRGVISLTQQGYKPKQPKTRLYLYPHQKSYTLYLITIGTANGTATRYRRLSQVHRHHLRDKK
jgi:hypothetical protein